MSFGKILCIPFQKIRIKSTLVLDKRFRISSRLIESEIRLLSDSVFFDENFYLKNNPDILHLNFDPIRHYLVFGGLEGRNPSELFNSAFYLSEYPDVKSSGMNPLIHYLKYGILESRKIVDLPKSDNSVQNQYVNLIIQSGFFDESFYMSTNPDLSELIGEPVLHYLNYGGFEGRNPSERFDSMYYMLKYNDVKEIGMNPLIHFLLHGHSEGRKPIPDSEECFNNYVLENSSTYRFDYSDCKTSDSLICFRDVKLIRDSDFFNADFYLLEYPDVKISGIDPALHYLVQGWKEGRNPSKHFNSNFYLERYDDVRQSIMNPLLHYINFGVFENRLPCESKNNYLDWVRKYDTLSSKEIEEVKFEILSFATKPVISLIMPVFNPNPSWLVEAIESIQKQLYPYWELCIADDCSTDPEVRRILIYYQGLDDRIKVIFRSTNGNISVASNSSLELATGDYIALFDHDDILPTHALFWVAKAIINNPDAKLLYSDEDKIDENGIRQSPYFKCDWNPELLYSQNMISHLGIYQTKIIRKIGGFRVGYEGSQDYELALRFVEQIDESEIVHIPKVLYHWRLHQNSTSFNPHCKNNAYLAAEKAVNEHLSRINKMATVTVMHPGMYRVKYQNVVPPPHVTIIIPSRNQSNLLRNCISSILGKTNYLGFDILIINNASDEPDFFELIDDLSSDTRVTCISDNRPFNYSALKNRAVNQAIGKYVCLLNNDTEVITAEWLSEMMSVGVQPGIGAVGAKLYYPDGKIQHAGVILGIGGLASHAHKFLSANTHGYFGRAILMQEISAVTGACLLVEKSKYLEVGGLDEVNLPVAFNDVDFCLRLKKLGYRNIWTPFAELYHHESISRGDDTSTEKIVRFQNEILYFTEKWKQYIENDPAYNPNLTFTNEKFELAWPPRNISIQKLDM